MESAVSVTAADPLNKRYNRIMAKQPSVEDAEKALQKARAKGAKKLSKPTAKKSTSTKRSQTPKIDWIEAQQFYLLDATTTYADVAKQFGVSQKSVEQWAKKMGWVALRNKLGETATNMMMKRLAKKKVAANDRHVSNYKSLQDKVMLAVDKLSDQSDPSEMLALAKALKTASDGERVALGLPTMVNSMADKDGNDFATAFADAWVNARKLLSGSND